MNQTLYFPKRKVKGLVHKTSKREGRERERERDNKQARKKRKR